MGPLLIQQHCRKKQIIKHHIRRLPDITEFMPNATQARMAQVFIRGGDDVARNDTALTIAYEGVEMALTIPHNGEIVRVLVKEGDIVKPNEPVFIMTGALSEESESVLGGMWGIHFGISSRGVGDAVAYVNTHISFGTSASGASHSAHVRDLRDLHWVKCASLSYHEGINLFSR